jgi:hypothetical protein
LAGLPVGAKPPDLANRLKTMRLIPKFFWPLFFGSLQCLAAGPRIAVVEAPAAAPHVEGAPSMRGVTYSIFDNATGARTGRLKIDRVDFEYRRQGFLTVAWRPQMVLEGVDLEIGANLAWESQGVQIIRALTALGRHDEVVMRNVRVHLARPQAQEITARVARLTPTGALELSQAGITGEGDAGAGGGIFLLPLTGPHAGQLLRSRPPGRLGNRGDLLNGNSDN